MVHKNHKHKSLPPKKKKSDIKHVQIYRLDTALVGNELRERSVCGVGVEKKESKLF